jgi:hypothetical protein
LKLNQLSSLAIHEFTNSLSDLINEGRDYGLIEEGWAKRFKEVSGSIDEICRETRIKEIKVFWHVSLKR